MLSRKVTNVPDFGNADIWWVIYTATYAFGLFLLKKFGKNISLGIFNKFKKNTTDITEEYRLLKELYEATVKKKDREIEELRQELAVFKENGGVK